MKEQYGFNHAHKANKQNLNVVSFEIPITAEGEFDLDIQNDIAKKYLMIEQCRNEIAAKLDEVLSQKIEL